MADTLFLISNISFAAAAICLLIAILLFVRFNIPDVIGDLNGKNAKKLLEQNRKQAVHRVKSPIQNQTAVNYIRQISPQKEATTDPLDQTADKMPQGTVSEQGTELLPEQGTELLREQGTELLREDGAGLRKQDAYHDSEETALLDENLANRIDEGATELLVEDPIRQDGLQMLDEVMLIHTTESIEMGRGL